MNPERIVQDDRSKQLSTLQARVASLLQDNELLRKQLHTGVISHPAMGPFTPANSARSADGALSLRSSSSSSGGASQVSPFSPANAGQRPLESGAEAALAIALEEKESLQKRLTDCETKRQRLKDAYQQTIASFRDACYQLTGYKVQMMEAAAGRQVQYRLRHLYAEREADDLLFIAAASGGELQLVQTDFCAHLHKDTLAYLHRLHSIPAFLAQVTLDLFGRTTMALQASGK